MSRRCARCGVSEDIHYDPQRIEQLRADGWTVSGFVGYGCRSYVQPAPWWLRAANRILAAINRRMP